MKKLWFFILIYAIFILGAAFRLFNVNWDSGYHMHPDERAIVLSVVKLSPPTSLKQFMSADSPWNPKFFAYGSLPFYLLFWAGRGAGILFNSQFATYDGIEIIGRYLSAFFDLGTMLIIFLLSRRLFPKPFALLATFLYAVSVLPVQLSHFYAVDTLLTFFMLGTLYMLIRYLAKPSRKLAVLIGFFFGCALATKASATTLLLPIGLTFLWDLLVHLYARKHHPDQWGRVITTRLSPLLTMSGLFFITASLTFFYFPALRVF